jgi:hypothetical protein
MSFLKLPGSILQVLSELRGLLFLKEERLLKKREVRLLTVVVIVEEVERNSSLFSTSLKPERSQLSHSLEGIY